ncbi:MAG: Gfo/Idh/MocA family oxidoreductase [Candidatus Omnitrophica bacterium]|nr:Gfo/Idh/MocA family oxidoreductase [Candidatus Omnitrophota bacterium]
MKRLKILQAGLGGFGKSWVKIIGESGEWELAGIADVNRENLDGAAKEYGIPAEKCFTSFDEAVKKTEPSALLNVTPPEFHKGLSIRAFKAGLDVLVEKPLSDNMKDAEEMVASAEKTGRKFMVSQNYRYRSRPRTLKKLLDEEIAGKISYVKVDFQKMAAFSGFRAEMDYPLLIDMAIHHFDLMRYITGKNPVRIYTDSWNPSWSRAKGDAAFNIMIEFAGNIHLSYSGSWVSAGKETSWDGTWEIYGEKGTLSLQDGTIFFITEKGMKKISALKLEREDRYMALYEFYSSIKENREPETSGRDNLNSLSMVFNALKSAKSGQAVAFCK